MEIECIIIYIHILYLIKNICGIGSSMNFHASSHNFEKIVMLPSLHFKYFLIGLNESSCQAPFKTVLLFQKKIRIILKVILLWKN